MVNHHSIEYKPAVVLHPLNPGPPTPAVSAALLFFDHVYLLPPWKIEEKVDTAWKKLIDHTRTTFDTKDVHVEREEHTQGRTKTDGFTFKADELLPFGQIALEHVLYLQEVKKLCEELKPLIDDGIIRELPKIDDASKLLEGALERKKGTALILDNEDARLTIRWSQCLFGLEDCPFLERHLATDNVSPNDNTIHVTRFRLGMASYIYYARCALKQSAPLLTPFPEIGRAMTDLMQCLSPHSDAETGLTESAIFKVFRSTLSLLLPSFTPKAYDVIVDMRRQLNKHGELEEFRYLLRTDVLLKQVAEEDERSIDAYVRGKLEPQLRIIERATKARWKTFASNLYEKTVGDIWQPFLTFAASGYVLGEPLAGLILASMSTVFSEEKATQKEIKGSSPLYSQLQYVVSLRKQERCFGL